MLEAMEGVVREFVAARSGREFVELAAAGADPWTIRCSFRLNDAEVLQVRTLAEDDVSLLKSFGAALGPASRDHFCPYPWGDESRLEKALESAVQQSLRRVDLSFLILSHGSPVGLGLPMGHGLPVGHFFLWKAGGNPHSAAHGVQVPELGVAVADSHQRRGLGALAVRFLLAAARSLDADAVELTTALTNSSGWNTYLKTGFEYVGNIRNPLEVDVTSAALGEVRATSYREERQMVYLIDPARRSEVLDYLAVKRAES